MRRLRRFCSHRWEDRLLWAEAVVLTAGARLAILCLPVRRTARWLGQQHHESTHEVSREHDDTVARVKWAVGAAARHVPWEAKCLVQAMAARAMLGRRGIDGTIYLGLARDEENQLQAHAWLRCGPWLITGGPGHGEYTVVSRFAFPRTSSVAH